jgi:prophage DNA circulation protein
MARGGYCPQYQAASFKGFPIEAYDVDSGEHGRRAFEGEFVFANFSDSIDMGVKIRHYGMRARFVENNHLEQAMAFIAVCESPGAGFLVHPANGQVFAICTSAKLTNNLDESQGITEVDLQFVESGGDFGLSFLGAAFGLNIAPIIEAARGLFERDYKRGNVRYLDLDRVSFAATHGIKSLQNWFLRGIASSSETKDWQAAAAFNDTLQLSATETNATKLFDDYENGARLVAQVTKPESRFTVFRSIANDNALGSASQAESAVYSSVRMIAGAHMAQAAIENPGRTIDEGLAKYDAVMALLEQEALIARAACDNATFLAIRTFAADAGKQILSAAYGLPAMTKFNFNGGVHSLVAAYGIFGDAKRYQEIEANNAAYLPFLTGPTVIAPSI